MALCNCIKGDFNVLVSYLGCSKLVLQDVSDWMVEGDVYGKPDTYELQITTPNRSTPVTLIVNTAISNIYSPADLGSLGLNLTDGIYCFKVTSCGNSYTRNVMISCSIECCLEDAVSKLKNREEIVLLDEIRLLLDSSKINTEIGNLTKAKEQYKMVTKMLKRLNCSCS